MTEYYNVIKVSGEKRLWKRICKEDEEVKTKVRNWINSIKEERHQGNKGGYPQFISLTTSKYNGEVLRRTFFRNNRHSIYCRCLKSVIYLQKTKMRDKTLSKNDEIQIA